MAQPQKSTKKTSARNLKNRPVHPVARPVRPGQSAEPLGNVGQPKKTPKVKATGTKAAIKQAGKQKKPKFIVKPQRSWWKKIFLGIGVLAIVYLTGMFTFGAIYQYQHRNDPVQIGTSFSKDAANELGVDWRSAYTALLDDMQIRQFRLMSYWYSHEYQRGNYEFNDLDWQMDEAAKRGAKVSLSVGLRQPRWPECHQPEWAKELNDEAWRTALYAYIEKVVERYRNHPALESWHLENEFYNRNFGECEDFSTDRLYTELDLVRKTDPDHPVIITLADQLGFPFFGPRPDIYATSLYRGNFVKFIGYFPYPIPTHFYSAKSFFVDLLHGKDMYIHELQLEPWGPRATKYLSIEEQDYYMNTSRMQGNIDFGLDTGMKKMNLWGAEWWYWRKVHFDDPGPWDLVKENINRHNTK